MHIKIENLSFRYKTPGATVQAALNEINLEIQENEFVAIVGLSGSGKTTLMQHITGLLKPDTGRVLVNGLDLRDRRVNISQIRRQIGLVFQLPETQLFEETVFDDVAFGLRHLNLSQVEISKRVESALATVGLDLGGYSNRSPFELSGGERRRVAIAGVVAMEPACLILDEPTSELDSRGRSVLMDFLAAYHGAGKTVVLISHDFNLVMMLAKRAIFLDRGQVIFDGLPREMFFDERIRNGMNLPFPRAYLLSQFLSQKGLLPGPNFWTANEIIEHFEKSG